MSRFQILNNERVRTDVPNLWLLLSFDSKKVKGKVRPITGLQGPGGEYRCSSTRSLTSALVGGG